MGMKKGSETTLRSIWISLTDAIITMQTIAWKAVCPSAALFSPERLSSAAAKPSAAARG